MTARLPLAMVAMVLVVAVGTTQIAADGLTRQVEVQLDRMGQIYLDGLTAALMTPVLRNDAAGIEGALGEALRIHQGLVDRRLALLNREGGVLARIDRAGLQAAELPAALSASRRGDWLDDEDGSYWVWRPLADARASADAATTGLTVVANLDVTDYVAERRQLWWRVIAFNLLLAVACAVLGMLLIRRLIWSVTLVTQHLQRSARDGPAPIPSKDVPAHDRETARLLLAYNRMARASQERELLLARMAEHEREAVLGRLAATLAHEVRNPLAGVLASIDTLRKFGEQPQARTEALDFMERGMRALEQVANATLTTYRPSRDMDVFGPQDLHDVERLVAPQARRAGVELLVHSSLDAPVAVAGNEVRQVLLNLLLNAVKASVQGSQVTLRCTPQPAHLRLEVEDHGAGLPEALADDLETGIEPPGEAGLGIAVVVRLVQQLRGRVTRNPVSPGHALPGPHADRVRHGVRRRRAGGAADARRRRRLPDQALRCGRTGATHPRPGPPGSGVAATGQALRPVTGHPPTRGRPATSGEQAGAGPVHGGNRGRQGRRRAPAAPALGARERAVRGGQLRRRAARADGKPVFRS